MIEFIGGPWSFGGDTPIGRMGFGAMRLPAWPMGDQPDHDTALAVLRRAVELGINHIDTSGFYVRDGVAANDLIREALHPYPDDLVIVTKVAPSLSGAHGAGLRDWMRSEIEANLNSLGLDQIAVVNLRAEGLFEASDESVGDALQSLAALRDDGLIRHIGLSNVTAKPVEEARDIVPIVQVQNFYNLRDRGDDPLVDACAEQGVAYVPYFPLGGDGSITTSPPVQAVAERHSATPAQVALAWLLQRSPAIVLIPGTASVAHLEENVAATSLTLSQDDLLELDSVRS